MVEGDSDIDNNESFVDECETIESISESESEDEFVNESVFEHIPNYILHNSEQVEQISIIDTRPILFQSIQHFPDTNTFPLIAFRFGSSIPGEIN